MPKGVPRTGLVLRLISIETLQTKGFREISRLNKRLSTTISDVFEMLRNLEKANRRKLFAG